jgi:S1-C subfamily serine protease
MLTTMLVASLLASPASLGSRVLPVLGEDMRPIATATALTKRLYLTNAHVPEDSTAVLLRCDTKIVPGKVIAVSKTADLALIGLATDCDSVHPSAVLGVNPELGLQVWVVGYPLRQFAVKGGVLSAYRNITGYHKVVEFAGLMDAEVLPGSSGGPVLDDTGSLVGIVSGYVCQDVPGEDVPACLSVFVTADTIRAFLRDVKTE